MFCQGKHCFHLLEALIELHTVPWKEAELVSYLVSLSAFFQY